MTLGSAGSERCDVTRIGRLENRCCGTPMMAATMADEMGVRRWYGMIPGSLLLSTSTAKSQEVLGVFGSCRSVAIALEMEEGT